MLRSLITSSLLLVLMGCGGNGTVSTQNSTFFSVPDRAMIITNGYTRGDLVVSARFIGEDQIEIISARYTFFGNDGYWYTVPASRSIINRQNTEWTTSISWDLGFAYQVSEAVVENRELLTFCDWEFTPAVLIPDAETATAQRQGEPPFFLPILEHSSPSWCEGDFRPEWVVAISPSGKKMLAIGAVANSTHTDPNDPNGRVSLPMAILEAD